MYPLSNFLFECEGGVVGRKATAFQVLSLLETIIHATDFNVWAGWAAAVEEEEEENICSGDWVKIDFSRHHDNSS